MSQRLDKNQPWHKHAFAKERKFREPQFWQFPGPLMLGESLIKCGPIGLNNFGGLDGWLYFHFSIDKISPLQFGGGCWDPWFCRGPQRQAPCVHFTKSISALQGRELPSTKSRTFHSKNIWQGKFMFSTKSRTSHVQASKQIKKYHLLS